MYGWGVGVGWGVIMDVWGVEVWGCRIWGVGYGGVGYGGVGYGVCGYMRSLVSCGDECVCVSVLRSVGHNTQQ